MLAPPALEMLTPSFVDQGDRWEFGQDFVVQVDNGLVRTCLDTGSLANRFRDQLALLRLTPSVDKFEGTELSLLSLLCGKNATLDVVEKPHCGTDFCLF